MSSPKMPSPRSRLARSTLREGRDAPVQVPLGAHVGGECVLRYDNETGKGDHRHVGTAEAAYAFSGYERLLADFWKDVDAWRQR